MKVYIEVDPSLPPDEVHVRCAALTSEVRALERQLAGPPRMVFHKDGEEFYFPLGEVLFFETQGEAVWAHTATDAYRIHYRLYELEELLPRQFLRAAKSTIVNTAKIYSIRFDPLSTSRISFADTHKQVHASRHYYKVLKQRLGGR